MSTIVKCQQRIEIQSPDLEHLGLVMSVSRVRAPKIHCPCSAKAEFGTSASLDCWLADPVRVIAGQKMGYTVADAACRADLIAYLKA